MPIKTAKPIADLTVDELRRAVNVANNTRDPERWTGLQWLKLYAAYQACGWDITPDEWTEEQATAAIQHGTVPTFKD